MKTKIIYIWFTNRNISTFGMQKYILLWHSAFKMSQLPPPFKWHFAGGPMMACFSGFFNPFSPHQLKKEKKKRKKKHVRIGPLLTKLSRSAHVKCSTKPLIITLFSTHSIISIIQTFSCKSLYFLFSFLQFFEYLRLSGNSPASLFVVKWSIIKAQKLLQNSLVYLGFMIW